MCVQAKNSKWEQPAAHGTTVSAPQALANLESKFRALVGDSAFFYHVCGEEKMSMTQSRLLSPTTLPRLSEERRFTEPRILTIWQLAPKALARSPGNESKERKHLGTIPKEK